LAYSTVAHVAWRGACCKQRRSLSTGYVRSNDEIGLLARTFNTMLDRLGDHEQELERQLEKRTAQLHAAEEERLHMERIALESKYREGLGQIAAGVAHQFNNIMAAIMGQTELMLLDAHISKNVRESGSVILASAERGSLLSSQLLVYAGKDDATLEDLSGLGKRSPTTAASFSILLLALAGVPLTGGFLAKFYLFLSVIQGNLWWLAVIAVINSTISVFYYLRIMVYMYARPPKENDTFVLSYKMKVPVYITAAITLALGLWYPVFNWILTLSGGLFW